jgi:hypothetical protein
MLSVTGAPDGAIAPDESDPLRSRQWPVIDCDVPDPLPPLPPPPLPGLPGLLLLPGVLVLPGPPLLPIPPPMPPVPAEHPESASAQARELAAAPRITADFTLRIS